jgi:ribosome-associated protein
MKQIEFSLDDQEFIELNRLLKLMSLASSGGEANMFISNGEVLVNGEVELRKRNKIREGFKVKFNGQIILVKS